MNCIHRLGAPISDEETRENKKTPPKMGANKKTNAKYKR
jgi:hypothetical protein